MLCRCPVLVMAKAFICLSLRACLSHPAVPSKRCKLGSRNLHCQVREGLCYHDLKDFLEIPKGSPRSRAVNKWAVGEICNFQLVSRCISGWNRRYLVISVGISSVPLQLKPILLCCVIMCLIGFPVTLICLTLRYHFMLKLNEDTPILSATKMFAWYSSFWHYKFIRICAGLFVNWVTMTWQWVL